MKRPLSEALLTRAKKVIPGGVNSPVRAFSAVGGKPPFIKRASKCWLFDEDDNRYLDLIGSWGPMIAGHSHPKVLEALQQCLVDGTSFGAPTRGEVLFAEELCAAHPALDMVRLCSSGTESTMHAIRLARGYTQRDIVIKIDGCYHGAHDSVLVEAGSGVATFANPGSPGIPRAFAELTKTAPFNDLDILEAHLKENNVAAVILEAVPGNMGCIIPKEGYLQGVIDLCTKYGALSIVDEVMTGFRLARGGACEYFDIRPDLVCLGKIVGGGLPLAAFGGRAEVMHKLSPLGGVYQAGTLSGNPLAVSAGRATLSLLDDSFYASIEVIAKKIESRIAPMVRSHGYSFARVGSMFTIFFRENAPANFAEVRECDLKKFGQFHAYALERGLYFPPSQFEAVFLSNCIADAEIDLLCKGVEDSLGLL